MLQTQQVFIAIKQILEKHGTPSVASIKGTVGGGVPLPAIITGLKQWQANPNIIEEMDVSPRKSKKTENQSETNTVEKRLVAIEQDIKEIKSLLIEIKNKL